MEQNENLEALLSALVRNIPDNELLLSVYQSDIAAAITSKRLSMKMNQTAFAEYLNVSQGLVSKWEKGDTNFTLKTLVDLAQKLSLKLTVKLEDEDRRSSGHAPVYSRTSSGKVIAFPQQKQAYRTIGSTPEKWTIWESSGEELKEM